MNNKAHWTQNLEDGWYMFRHQVQRLESVEREIKELQSRIALVYSERDLILENIEKSVPLHYNEDEIDLAKESFFNP